MHSPLGHGGREAANRSHRDPHGPVKGQRSDRGTPSFSGEGGDDLAVLALGEGAQRLGGDRPGRSDGKQHPRHRGIVRRFDHDHHVVAPHGQVEVLDGGPHRAPDLAGPLQALWSFLDALDPGVRVTCQRHVGSHGLASSTRPTPNLLDPSVDGRGRWRPTPIVASPAGRLSGPPLPGVWWLHGDPRQLEDGTHELCLRQGTYEGATSVHHRPWDALHPERPRKLRELLGLNRGRSDQRRGQGHPVGQAHGLGAIASARGGEDHDLDQLPSRGQPLEAGWAQVVRTGRDALDRVHHGGELEAGGQPLPTDSRLLARGADGQGRDLSHLGAPTADVHHLELDPLGRRGGEVLSHPLGVVAGRASEAAGQDQATAPRPGVQDELDCTLQALGEAFSQLLTEPVGQDAHRDPTLSRPWRATRPARPPSLHPTVLVLPPGRRRKIEYTTGITTRVRKVELIRPPSTTSASGCEISPPPPAVLSPEATGTRATMVARAVIRMGRIRTLPARASAWLSSWPERFRSTKSMSRMALETTIPSNMRTPSSAGSPSACRKA